ncbi:MAG TPA: PAS domain-containing protein [Polyangiaceae bacterium]|nr:PAS domain-containing protein [Polyangiaceae bacterium]
MPGPTPPAAPPPAQAAALLAHASDGLAALDAEGRCTYLNPAAARLLGVPPEAALGRAMFEALPGLAGTAWECGVRAALDGRGATHFEADGGPPGGRLDVSIYPDGEGGAALAFRDVSERGRAERERAARAEADFERERLRRVLAELPAAIALVRPPDWVFTFTNAESDRLGGRPTPPGSRVLEVFPEFAGEGNPAIERLRRVVEARAPETIGEYGVVLAEGGASREVFARGVCQPLLGPGGEVEQVLSFLVDVTEEVLARRRAEALAEEVRRHERLLATVSDALPALVAYILPDERYRFVNAGYEAWLGVPRASILGKTMREVLGERVYEAARPHVEAALRGEASRLTTEVAYGSGVVRWVDVTYTPHVGPGGAVQGLVALTLDVSERKRAEVEREALLASAEAAGRAKDEFLSTLSHELRTPLNAILGWSNLLRTGSLPEARRAQALETIERNARAQARLVDDLLDLSRIVQGKLALRAGPLEVARVVEAALEALRPAAEAKGVRLEPALDPRAAVVGDEGRLQQVAWNLLSNAIKFTAPGGRVRVRVRREPSHVELSVEDTGRGIAPDFLPHVFERFRQADGSITRAHGGLGLGLSIVRSLVELHGGAVTATSEGEGRGAAFTVRLPAAPPPGPAPGSSPPGPALGSSPPGPAPGSLPPGPATGAPPPAGLERPPELRALRVLVVDDEPDARDLVAHLLRRGGAHVAAAAGAAEALELLRGARFDALVSDVGMPGVDGYELLRRVRALPAAEGGLTPALALTAYARAEDRAAALRAGFQLYVAKPIEPGELFAALVALTRR